MPSTGYPTCQTISKEADMKNQVIQDSMLKPTLILATLLFLIVAPAPDSRDIAEMTADFLVPSNHSVLMAAEETIQSSSKELLN